MLSAHDEEHLSAPLWICISVLCVGQLLLVMGLLYCGKLTCTENKTQAIKEGELSGVLSYIAALILLIFNTFFLVYK